MKFKVEIVETYRRYVEVEAEDEDAAYQDIDDKINEGEIDLSCDGEDYKYDRELFVSEVKENNERLKKMKMKSMEEVKKCLRKSELIEEARCPECGGILVTNYGPGISCTFCVECDYNEYDYY